MARLPVLFICVLLHSAFKSYAKDTYHKLCSVIDLRAIINEISRWECLKKLFYISLLLIYKIPPYKVLPERTGHVGFEPTNAGIKILCLTAWRMPNTLFSVKL